MKYLLTWLALVVAVILGLGGLVLPPYYRLVNRGVAAPATVIEIVPDLHSSVYYQYSVGGNSFQANKVPWPPNPALQALKVGQQVVIYYEPEHPEHSVLGAPYPMLKNELRNVILVALFVSTILVWGVSSKSRPRSLWWRVIGRA